ncbi:DUF1223 domain-containing protein [Primorskyibacter sp. 2E107]|uniref:DUF1223 domain-containing protein n=1 Tax=Primorskyibacter sp. 2E107 TaxID=3403458 RepID=UPI003AF9B504
MLAQSIRTAAFGALLAIQAPFAAMAQDPAIHHPVVVELYTSQGCSSCPPADALLAELSERDDVIPLAMHVDYWDYIGWKDRFAVPAFTTRQKGYAHAQGEKMIYTPQVVVNGREDAVGSRPMKVVDLIRKHAAQGTPVQLTLTRSGSELLISVRSSGQLRPCDVHLVRYMPEREVNILRGENAGHSFTYTNIVNDWQVVGTVQDDGSFEKRVTIEGDNPVVVLVQEQRYGPILAAARLR